MAAAEIEPDSDLEEVGATDSELSDSDEEMDVPLSRLVSKDKWGKLNEAKSLNYQACSSKSEISETFKRRVKWFKKSK